jgi:hypothetical protein
MAVEIISRMSKSFIELLVQDKSLQLKRAHEQYHNAFMSVVDNEIQVDFVLDAIAPSVMDYYHRATEEYNLVCKMLSAYELKKTGIAYFGNTLILEEF